MFQNITQDLSAILSQSDERNKSILPRDLKTAVKIVEVVYSRVSTGSVRLLS